jgi:hypothetical protein
VNVCIIITLEELINPATEEVSWEEDTYPKVPSPTIVEVIFV